MAWERGGDTALTHPVVVRGATVAGADSRTMRELYGTAKLLASVCGAHLTDYVVDLGHLMLVCGPDLDRLTAQLVEAGYLTPFEVDGRPAWRLIDDPELIHLRTRAEVEWDRQRKRDTSNADVTLRVLHRDGSACRYCGKSVSWTDRRGGRGATYDHRQKPARSADDMVVACRSCNSARGEPGSDQAAAFDRNNPILPVPEKPHYCDHARARLAKAGLTVDPASAPPASPRPTRPPRPANQAGTAGAGESGRADLADLAEGPEASFPGTGRVGSGAAARRRARRRRARSRDEKGASPSGPGQPAPGG